MPIATVSGIRGTVGTDLTPEYVLQTVGRFAANLAGKRVAIARDPRPSSPLIQRLAESVLLQSGCDVVDVGVSSTPGLLHFVRHHGVAGGLMITASHNPPDWNGLKPVTGDGRLPFAEELAELLSAALPAEFRRGQRFANTNDYPDGLVRQLPGVSAAGTQVVVDAGGGAVGVFLPAVFQALECRATWWLDAPGVFARAPDPTADALLPLRHLVRSVHAEVGFAFDPDGDRLVLVDQGGNVLGADVAILLALRSLLELTVPRAAVVSVDSSQAIEELLQARGVPVYEAPVGEPNVTREMVRRGADVGIEGSSGGLIWDAFVRGRDGALAACLIVRLLGRQRDLTALLAEMPRLHQARLKLSCSRADSVRVLASLARDHPDAETIDGLKLRVTPSTWVLLRPSNTEEVLRISVEAATSEEATHVAESWAREVRRRLERA